MKLKGLFNVSSVALALALAGCGGDINITPTTIDNSTYEDNSVTTSTTTGDDSEENVCASYEDSDGDTQQGSYDDGICTYSTSFASASNEITEDLTLTADAVHYFTSSLIIGEGCDTSTGCTIDTDGPTLTIEAGTTVVFGNTSSLLRINRGAKIEAEGTYDSPIEITSANTIDALDSVGLGPSPQDWGGVMINGFGITDQCSDAERAADNCNAESEGAVSYYGGSDNTDDSGTLKYVKIHYAGGLPTGADEGDDLNSLSLFAVGSGTEIDYIDIYAGYDDGIELFGGAVDLTHIAVTDTQDDSIDIDAGWQGNAQYIFIKHGTVVNASGDTIAMGNGGFEADGEKGDTTTEAPASAPLIANVTVITTDNLSVRDGDPSLGIKLDDSIGATWYNTIIQKESATQSWCVNYSTDAADNIVTNTVSINSSYAACAQLAATGSETVTSTSGSVTVESWFTTDGVSVVGNGSDTVIASNGFSTSADVSITATDMSTIDADYFESTDYVGAVSPTDTSSDWYNWVNDAFDNADDE